MVLGGHGEEECIGLAPDLKNIKVSANPGQSVGRVRTDPSLHFLDFGPDQDVYLRFSIWTTPRPRGLDNF